MARVAVGNPDIADVQIINKREFLVTGKTLGITSLMVWNRAGAAPREYRIRVGAVSDPVRTSRPDPELAQATVDQGRGVEGQLPNLLAHRRARIAATAPKDGAIADRSAVALDTQVMTQVKVAEVNRSAAQQFGFHLSAITNNSIAALAPPGLLSGVTIDQNGGTFESGSGFLPLRDAFNLVLGDPARAILGTISVLERKGLARTLAEPSLIAGSGQTASYLAGGEFPVPVSQGGATAGGITVQYKEFGVRLNLTPTVLARNRIALKVAPEVSELDFSAGIQIGGVSVPALTVRRTDTTIELGDGESFVVSGLVSHNMINSVNKVPWLGDLPVLGAFFRSTTVSKQEKELVMVVTPHLVRPLAKGAQTPPLPGQKYDNYDPSFTQTFFLETGDFDTGFSR